MRWRRFSTPRGCAHVDGDRPTGTMAESLGESPGARARSCVWMSWGRPEPGSAFGAMSVLPVRSGGGACGKKAIKPLGGLVQHGREAGGVGGWARTWAWVWGNPGPS